MRLIICITFLGLALTGFGQRFTATWSKNRCEIGEQVELKLRLANAPKKVGYKPYVGEIPCEMKFSDSSTLTKNATLEIVKAFEDTTYLRGKEQIWEGRYTVMIWDTGVYIIPRFAIGLTDTSLVAGGVSKLRVGFTKQNVDDEIEEMQAVIPTDYWYYFKTYWWLILFPLAIIIVLLIRRRNRVTVISQLSLKQRSQIALNALRKQAYWKKGKVTEHYIEFSFLLRSFLSARYELNLAERTTYEAMLLLSRKNIPTDTLKRIREMLTESDMVKFAKGVPGEEEILLSLRRMEELIVELSPLDLIE